MTVIGNIVVGKRDVDMTTPSHVPGVREGNWPFATRRRHRRRPGHELAALPPADWIVSPSRSTGINPERHWPIDPHMPKLTPP
jgi:hypothetical protein